VDQSRIRGFSLTEIMVVVAVLGVAAAMTVPAWQRMRVNSRAKTTARLISNAFQLARAQAIMTEEQHVVMWTAFSANDACNNPLPGPIVILDDTNGDCCIDPGEPIMSVSSTPATDFANLNWGVTFATARVVEDGGGGTHTTGSSFSDQFGVQTNRVAFRNDGVPVAFTNACAMGNVGTGAGGIYLTNGAAAGGERDYAVVLSALGVPKVYSWDSSMGVWTN
jgi:prepilin-type N-terminal cleavage/methylation domain-containing protein